VRFVRLIAKPFLSILYVLRSSMSYSSIFPCSKLKYSLYLYSESALWRTRLSLALYLVVRLMCWRCRKRVTQASDASYFPTALAKFRTISRVGGKPRSVYLSMYTTSSDSCCGLSSCCSSALAATVFDAPRCLRDNVVRLTPNCLATARYENDAPGSRDSIALIAALIASILMEL
jgi:hypothetical protein